jgi:hypothetical protein
MASMKKVVKFLNEHLIGITAITLFLVILPLTLKINFNQNDDWNRTLTTKEFIKGNFELRDETANTFYLQGILGTIFYYITGSEKFPILTLIFSVLNFFIFAKIANDFYLSNKYKSILFGMLMFLNPFHVYSIFGFMAENFYLFFMLLSVYFFDLYRHRNRTSALVLSNLISIAGLFIKQVSIVTQMAFMVYLIVSRNVKGAIIQTGFTVASVVYYYFLFPRTGEMHTKDITAANLVRGDFVFSLTWANLIYLVIFLLPLIPLLIAHTGLLGRQSWKSKALLIGTLAVLALGTYFFYTEFFRPAAIGSAEFPFIKNTFTRFGFFTSNLHGTAYQFIGKHDLYSIWPDLAFAGVLFLAGIVAIYNKRLHTPYVYFMAGYLLLMVMITEMFDRYLLPIYPMFILLYLNLVKEQKLLQTLTIFGWVMFLGMLNYQYAMDFVLTNNYIWSKSREIMKKENLPGEEMSVNRAWKRIYPSQYPRTYYFSYDSPKVNEEFRDSYQLVDVKRIEYPLNMHVNPNIYLYKNLQK